MSHLENLIAEYYDWKGYLVKRNIKVGKLSHGGWEMKLDVIAFDPHNGHLTHPEPSIDAHSWAKREERFTKKFTSARKHSVAHVRTGGLVLYMVFSGLFKLLWWALGNPVGIIAIGLMVAFSIYFMA